DANGLSGTGDLTRNTLKVRLAAEVQSHFETGDIIAISVDAKSTCGQDLSTINLNVDPVETFGRTTSIGLDDLSNNWSMSWVDFDVDGDVDIFLTNYDINQPNQLLENRGNGEFSPVTEGALVTDLIGVSQGAAWGDYNNDGLPDVYITNNIGATNALYRNLGDGNFVRIQGDPSVAYDGYSFGTSWADYDNDGYLDLFVAEFFASRFNKLFHNNGDGTFTEVNDAAIVFEAASSVNGFWADYDNDGDQDLFVVNHQGENNSLYRNDGNGQFTPMTESVVANDGGKSVGASWGDIDNDRDLDLFVANAGNEDNFLYTNNGDGTFTKVLSGPVVSGGGHSHGSAFGDIDNDGDLDLVVTNDSQQDNALYSNNGDGEFVETFNPISEEGGESFGSALGDYDNDGDLDLFIANHGENVNFFYENGRGQCQSSICINLVGVNSNRTGVGARISVLATINGFPTWQIREVSTQTGGLSSQGELRQLFGLGDAAQVDSIVVEWPSGHTQTMGSQPLGDCMEIEESGGALLMGTVYFDENIDCIKGNAEQRLANAEIIIEPINERVYTDDLGQFSVYLPLGNYVVSINPPSHWVANCTGLRHSVVLDDIDQIITDLDFGFEPSVDCENMPDLGVQVSSTAMRVGFDGLSAIYYQNIGTATAYDVTLEVDYPADMTLLEGTIPWDSVAGNTYFWFMDSLAIGQAITAYNKFFVDSTSTVGDSVSTLARINSANRDCNLDNNIYDERVELQGAIDPNDILVSPEGLIDAGEELTYKIRFQNIGTVAARNVRIENELPEEVDINSLVLGLASHPYRFQLLDDRKLVWYFDFINLPDSTSDLLGSQGFVSYKVKSKANLPAETEFGNDAQIYFDNLEPIQTNIVYNIIRNNNVDDSTQGSLLIYPNPALRSDEITIQLNPAEWGLERRIDRIEVFNNQGQLIREQRSINEESYQLDAEHFGPGIFWIRIQGVDGKTYQDRVIFM
ncbi:MAG: FG-GAP-like repeat-containing protein, partial [Bacteroidota bacterium]